MNRTHLALLSLVLLVPACNAPGKKADESRAIEAAALPWTRAFAERTVIVAEDIVVDGPDDLVEHIAAHQSGKVLYKAETVETGFLELYQSQGDDFAKVQLDQWELVGTKRIRVLRRPTLDVPVKISAQGEVYFARPATGEEARSTEASWIGERNR